MKNGHMVYKTSNVCSQEIQFDVVDGIVHNVNFIGGCRGNTQGLARMVIGRKADDVKEILRGVPCRGDTSCPDQLSKAIEAYEQQK